MQRTDLIRQIEAEGCVLQRHGKKHDIYLNPATGLKPIPRHVEIGNHLANHIKRYLGLKP